MARFDRWSLLLFPLVLLVVRAADDEDKIPVIGVSIEDFIDLDGPQSTGAREGMVLTSQPGGQGADTDKEVPAGHGEFMPGGLGPAPPPPPVYNSDVIKPFIRQTSVTSDDEDAEMSGDGSGSGEGLVQEVEELLSHSNETVTSQSRDMGQQVNRTLESPQDLVVGEGGVEVTDEVDDSVTSEVNLTVSDVIYTADVWPPVPVMEQTDDETDVQRWSPWIRMNDVTEVRVRTCSGNSATCNGTQAEMRTCDAHSNRCDVTEAVVRAAGEEEDDEERVEGSGGCHDDSMQDDEEKDQVIRPVQRPTVAPVEINLQRPEVEPCTFSLFDLKRGKYLASEWSLTRLVTQAKVKKWCARPSDYLVLHSPHAHCRRYYRDLCHVSMRCKGNRGTPKARGDFAEGCWRQFVYKGQLPVGLSNRQTIVYLICQRFAANSALGKVFGHKRSHFATLFDTKGRGPVVSLAAVTELGDTAWPDTQHFIEHGLVENDDDTTWFLRKARKGIVSLEDLGKCQNEDSCSLGAHQVLPSDYTGTSYRTAHLLWPELAGPDPLSRMATFTLTNTAPMHEALYPAWQRALQRVRKFAVDQCGLPRISPAQYMSSPLAHQHHMHHYYGNVYRDRVPTLYVASGVIPSRDPVETIGNDVNVPFMFWTAFCCVTDGNSTDRNDKNDNNVHNNMYSRGPYKDRKASAEKQHMSFAIYARNAGSGPEVQGQRSPVVMAPVLQLEMLLQDIYKTQPTDANVNLFPASDNACSELRNDVSRHIDL